MVESAVGGLIGPEEPLPANTPSGNEFGLTGRICSWLTVSYFRYQEIGASPRMSFSGFCSDAKTSSNIQATVTIPRTGVAFCRTRKTLIRCIREHVTLEPGEGDDLIEAAVARVERFPEMHVARPEPLRGVGRRQSRGDEVGGADRDEAGVWREGGRGRRPHSS